MSLLGLLSGEGLQNSALSFLKNHMIKEGCTMVSLSVRPDPKGKGAEQVFDAQFYKIPVTVVSDSDLETYKKAVLKCVEHGIQL